MHRYYNPNPYASRVGDCTIRAISKATNQDWYKTYIDVCLKGLEICDMPSANEVWGAYLKDKGFTRRIIPDTCPHCYTVKDFCRDHPKGMYILALNGHVVAVFNGDYYDSFDSGEETVIYYWEKKWE